MRHHFCLPCEFKEKPPAPGPPRALRLRARAFIYSHPAAPHVSPSFPPSSQSSRTTRAERKGDYSRHGDAGGRGEGRRGEEGARQGAVAAVPAARGGEGVGAMDRPRLLRRQHHSLRHHHVRQQLPHAHHHAARRQVRRTIPRPLLLPAAATEPAPRTILRHVSTLVKCSVDQIPGLGFCNLHRI